AGPLQVGRLKHLGNRFGRFAAIAAGGKSPQRFERLDACVGLEVGEQNLAPLVEVLAAVDQSFFWNARSGSRDRAPRASRRGWIRSRTARWSIVRHDPQLRQTQPRLLRRGGTCGHGEHYAVASASGHHYYRSRILRNPVSACFPRQDIAVELRQQFLRKTFRI